MLTAAAVPRPIPANARGANGVLFVRLCSIVSLVGGVGTLYSRVVVVGRCVVVVIGVVALEMALSFSIGADTIDTVIIW